MRASLLLVAVLFATSCCPPDAAPKVAVSTPPPALADHKDLALPGELHFKNLRQLTFGADNAEAYWSFDSSQLIMQTNHAPYACDQIEEMPAAQANPPVAAPGKLVGTGKGRSTCSYFLKGDQEIIYASTHDHSATCPTPPDMSKGYYWGLFEYDIYRANKDGSNLRKLTDAPGYDAEGTVCPVDNSIIFTSQRSGDLELWRMDADGSHLRQLTDLPGYDGGAFFSPDCTKIVWRSSRPTGKDLEEYKALLAQHLVKPTKMDLWIANSDGTDARQLTYLPGASFGPSFYPDGKRIIFASNYLSPRGPEFDLYGIDIDGSHLEKLTTEPSFDGFPMFSPDGKTLSFSSNRRDVIKGSDGKDTYRLTGGPAGEHDTNVFLADWVPSPPGVQYQPESAAVDRYHDNIAYLADDAREGRGIGTKGLADAEDYVQKQLAAAGVEPGPGGWRQTFEMVTDIKRKDTTALSIDGAVVDPKQFAPMVYSANKQASGALVAAGWGIVDKDAKLDDYKGVNAKGKIVLVHRFVPPSAKLDAQKTHDLGDIRRKAFTAKQKGAIGIIVVDDNDLKQDEAALPELRPGGIADAGAGAGATDAGIPIVVVTRAGAAALLAKETANKPHTVKLTVALEPVPAKTDNIIGVIHAGAATKQPGVIVLGAHLDHLGMGGPDALDPGVVAVHNGADDNASGVAALIEAAIELEGKKGELQRDVYIMAFSGEEEGLLGSEWFLKHPTFNDKIVAMINMDMVGRMRNNQLHINGADSAKEWHDIAQAACDGARVVCSIGGSGYGPSDQMAFYVAGAPVLFLFTGSHTDYHTATDDADKINSAGGVRAGMVAASAALAAANHPGDLTYVKAPPEPMGGGDGPRRASLGTVPSYDEDPNRPPGMVLSDVIPDGPAAKAGLQKGDRIVKLDDTEIRSVNELMFVLQTSKPGTPVKITYVRGGQTMTANATFGAPRQRH